MHSHARIVPAIMADEWDELNAHLAVVAPFADVVQIDVMDGHLVPSFSFPYNKTILDGRPLPHENIFYEVHLMVQHPHEVGERFIAAGAKRVIAQIEGFRTGEAEKVFEAWKEEGAEVGVSIMLKTPLQQVEELLERKVVSHVQVMSIERVGFQGGAFDERALVRIKELRASFPDVTLSVDGGIRENAIESVFKAGANYVGVGSAIMGTQNPDKAYATLQKLVEQYVE